MTLTDWQIYRKKVLDTFECQQSGNCCRCPGVVYAPFHVQEKMAKELKVPLSEFKQRYVIKENGWELVSSHNFRPNCFLTKENKCLVYQSRPMPCKTYPNWDSIWTSKDTLQAEAKCCPGLKKAIAKINTL